MLQRITYHTPVTKMRLPCSRIAWTTKSTCDFLPSYRMRYLLTQWPYEVGLTQKVFANNRPYEKVKMRMGQDPILSPGLEVYLRPPNLV